MNKYGASDGHCQDYLDFIVGGRLLNKTEFLIDQQIYFYKYRSAIMFGIKSILKNSSLLLLSSMIMFLGHTFNKFDC